MSILAEGLGIRPGITAVIGSGGKTRLIEQLALELKHHARVLVTTTTKIFPAKGMPLITLPDEQLIQSCFEKERCLCLGTPLAEGKLGIPMLPFERLIKLADYVLVEADGARQLPLKAHESWEPVIPQGARAILVAGLTGMYHEIRRAVHRPELFARIAGCSIMDKVTPERLAAVLEHEGLADLVLFNQGESQAARLAAEACARKLSAPSCVTSLYSIQSGTDCYFESLSEGK